jgi:hypothetical protein
MANYLRINIDYEENLVTPRTHKQMMNYLYRDEMETHRRTILPRHFQNVPETRPGGAYGYVKRSRKWEERKAREGRGANIPNVYTGGLRDAVLKSSIIRATASGATLTAKNHDATAPAGSYVSNGKRYSNKVRFPMTEQRRKEIEAISRREIERMVKRMKATYLRLASLPKFRRKRRTRLAVSSAAAA